MAGRVEGKAIIVTGAGSGIGRAFALGLAREGATVGVLDVNPAAAESVCKEIEAEACSAVPLDGWRPGVRGMSPTPGARDTKIGSRCRTVSGSPPIIMQ